MSSLKKINRKKIHNQFTQWLLLSAFFTTTAYSQMNASAGMNDALKRESAPKRDPFWPVGYVPEGDQPIQVGNGVKPAKSKGSINWDGAMKKIVINGVSSRANNEFFAVINGEVKQVGETIKLNHEGKIYMWAVDSITPPGSVKLRRVSAL